MSVSKPGHNTGQRFLGRFAVSSTSRSSLHKKMPRILKTHKKQHKRKSIENSIQGSYSKSSNLTHDFTEIVNGSALCTFPSQDIPNIGPTSVIRCPSIPSKELTFFQTEVSPLRDQNERSFAVLQNLERTPNKTAVDKAKLLLSCWGLPDLVLKQYHMLGIHEMFQWQVECLSVGETLNGGNLVFSAPTSAGKTMVAELLILKRILETKKKAIVILPFVSVAHEKVQYFKFLCDEVGIRVGGFLGSQTPKGGFKNVDIAVCTIEKGNSLVNRLLEDKELDQLGILVVDELHMIGDAHRGYLLELMLTKILFVSKQISLNKVKKSRTNDVPYNNFDIQIVGMSATLPNLHVIATWLDASLYVTNFRPVPLTECVKIGRTIFNSEMVKLRELTIDKGLKGDNDHVVPLCLETVRGGHSVLIFCPTKLWCEKLADTIAREFYHILRQNIVNEESNTTSLPIDKEATHDIKVQLERSPAGLDNVLGKTVQCGVAFHHAGLTFDEREIIESAFRDGILKVLVATSTLSSGVNLPARRVIIRSLLFYGQVIDARTYKQMVGRAGRKGVDTEGESILMCKINEKARAYELLNADLPPIVSSFLKYSQDGPSGSLKRAILEIIVSGIAMSLSDVALYSSCTLLATSVQNEESRENNSNLVSECIDFLQDNQFISLRNLTQKNSNGTEIIESCFFPTQLGSAVLASALSPDEGLHVFTELQRARRCFVLENELHILYLVTPIYNQDIASNLNWYNYYCLWEKLDSGQRRVAELVGVEEAFIAKAIRGHIPVKTSKQQRTLNVHKRFYICLCLNDLVQEMSLSEATQKYSCSKGQLQSLQQSAATFAGMVTIFCDRLGWSMLEVLLSQFHSRLTFGIQPELCDLVRISLLNGQQARLLFSAGFTSIADLATADVIQLEHILHTGTQFQSNKKTEDETEWEALNRLRKRRCIWLHGCQGMTAQEAALTIIKEAKHIIEDGLGGVELKWDKVVPASQSCVSSQTIARYRKELNTGTPEGESSSHLPEAPNLILVGKNHLVDSEHHSVPGPSTSALNPSTNFLEKTIADLREGQCSENTGSSQEQDVSFGQPELNQLSITANHMLRANTKLPLSKPEDLAYSNVRTVLPAVSSNGMSQTDGKENNSNKIIPCVNGEKKHESHHLRCLQLKADREVSHVSRNNNEVEHFEKFSENITVEKHPCRLPLTSNEVEFQDPPKSVTIETEDMETSDNTNQNKPLNSPVVGFHDNCADISATSDIFGDSLELDSQMLLITEKNANEQKFQVGNNNEETSPVLFAEDKYLKTRAELPVDKCTNFQRMSLLMTGDDKKMLKNPYLPHEGEEKLPDLPIFQIPESTSEDLYGPISLLPESYHERIAYDENMSFQNSSIEENDLFLSFEESEKRTCSSFDLKNDSAKEYETSLYINQSNEDLFTPLPSDVLVNQNCSAKDEGVFGESISETLIQEILPTELKNACEKKKTNSSKKKAKGMSGRNTSGTNTLKESPQNVVINTAGCRNVNNSMTSIKKRKRESSSSENRFFEEENEETSLKKSQYNNNNNNTSDLVSSTPSDLFSLSLDLSIIGTPPLFRNNNDSKKTTDSGSISQLNSSSLSSNNDNNIIETTAAKTALHIPKAHKAVLNNAATINIKNMTIDNNNIRVAGRGLSATKPPPPTKGFSSKGTIRAKCQSSEVITTAAVTTTVAAATTTRDQVTGSLRTANINCNGQKSRALAEGIENLDEHLDGDQHLSNKMLPLCDPSQPCSQVTFTIIDVCSSRCLFDTFIAEWSTKEKYALSIGCEKLPPKDDNTKIGANFKQGAPLKQSDDKDNLKFEGSLVVGFAICWNNHDAYYIALTKDDPTDEPDDSLAPPPLDTALSIEDRLQALRKIFTAHSHADVTVVAFDAKSTYRAITATISLAPRYTFMDPKIASWLLDPGAKESNFHGLIFSYLPSEQYMLDDIGGGHGCGSLGLTPTNPGSGRRRSTSEAVLIWHLMKHLEEALIEEQLYEAFVDVEIPFINTISRMELNGFGFSMEESEVQKNVMLAKVSSLEEEAYSLCGHPFSLSSPGDISKVLYLELQLPVNGNPNATVPKMPSKTLGPKRGHAGAKSSFSTSKNILEKLKAYHPLPGVILQWRQITNSLTKVVFPLLKAKVHVAKMKMYRIFGICQLHTATGRISMFDPNLQNIPKDFQIDLPDVIRETPVSVPNSRKSRQRSCKQQPKANNCDQCSFVVSMRNAFVPFEGGILVAADYSQLELRILAHLSKDAKLMNILNKDSDVFKLITSEWKNIPVEQVTDKQRQQAKQICYGMIYGIGAKALGEALSVDEDDAAVFMETFKSKYPGMKSYIQNTVKQCRQDGYVKTITGRKRYLPNIKSQNSYAKLQAERQAVNTTVQGSAADLMKVAMVNIDNELIKVFPATSQPHTVDNIMEYTKNGEILLKHRHSPRRQRLYSYLNQPSGAYLLLQIHDELIYEVGLYDLRKTASIIQTQMETAMQLSVRLPVKLKYGPSWAKLEELIL